MENNFVKILVFSKVFKFYKKGNNYRYYLNFTLLFRSWSQKPELEPVLKFAWNRSQKIKKGPAPATLKKNPKARSEPHMAWFFYKLLSELQKRHFSSDPDPEIPDPEFFGSGSGRVWIPRTRSGKNDTDPTHCRIPVNTYAMANKNSYVHTGNFENWKRTDLLDIIGNGPGGLL